MIDRQTIGVDINRDFDAVSPETIDPRLARTDEIRDRMIERRRRAGLADYPATQLVSQAEADRILNRFKDSQARKAPTFVAD